MSKYRNRRTERNGETYDSIFEANYHDLLKLRLAAGEFSAIQRQVPFPLHVDGTKIGAYKADYVLTLPDGSTRIHECKGFETDLWLWKQTHFVAEYPHIPLIVVRALR